MNIRGASPVLSLAVVALAQPAISADWSITEAHFAYGNLDIPTFAGGGDSDHFIYTLQHASGWKYGDNFFFVDFMDAQDPGFQDFDIYSEWYSNFSLGKIAGRAVGGGIVSDIGLIWGFNWASDANVKKYLPGFRLVLDLGGFAFANLDITAYIDDSEGVARGGAPGKTTPGWSTSTSPGPSPSATPTSASRGTSNTSPEGTRVRRQGRTMDSRPAAIPLEPKRAPLPGARIPVLAQQARPTAPPTRIPCRRCW